jgi:serine/threonine-protein kinase RsbW
MAEASRRRYAATLENLGDIREFVNVAAQAYGVDESAIADLCLAVDEAATNVVLHGYGEKPGDLDIEITADHDALVIKLSDRAPHFDPTTRIPHAPEARLEQGEVGGWGLHLIRSVVDEVRHRATSEGGNELTLIKSGVVARR